MSDRAKQLNSTDTASLYLTVTNEEDKPLLGNVFLVLCHEESGQKWRELRYHLKSRAYYYRGLPPGSFSVNVSAAGYGPARRDVVLSCGESLRAEINLAPLPYDTALILDDGEELDVYRRFAQELYHDREAREHFCSAPADTLYQYLSRSGVATADSLPALSYDATILAALINDRRVIDALTKPICLFSPDALSNWVEFQLLKAWEFHATEYMRDRVTMPIVERRVRLLALVRAVMRNSYVKTFLPDLDDADVTAHMLRFLASLDAPELDEVIPIIIQMLNPRLAPVERFARSLLPTFDARVPAGCAVPASSGAAQIDRPQAFGSSIEEIRELLREPTEDALSGKHSAYEDADMQERAAAVTFLLAEVAGCLAVAVDPAPLCITSLRTEGVYA